MAGAPAHNLPLSLSTFIGREKEIAEVHRWLAACRLVTLTGAGGAGKTRLALQAAAGLLGAFADGVRLIDFTPLADETLVAQAVATVLHVHEQRARPLVETLIDHLREQQILLLFDNCEHVAAACAGLATALLQACPELRVLAASREPLGVNGELVWIVPPLSLPTAQPWHDPAGAATALTVYAQSEAVQLFVARAMTAAPAFALSSENGPWVAEICRRLDGMPLALELAAARVRALSVREIAQRLDDRFRLLTGGSRTAPLRQQTLAATLDWSYKLLAEPERAVLQRLSVFAGGCTLAAAETVCAADDMPANAVLDVLSQLVDKSLVIASQTGDGVRYRLLETIRQYAAEKLLAAGAAEQVQERHCAFFVVWAEWAQTHVDEPDQVVWLRRYEVEHDNLRAALDWCRGDPSRAVAGLQLAAACAQFWELHTHGSEGAGQISGALARAGSAAPPVLRAWALARLASLLFMHSDFPAMRRYGEEALAIWRELGADGRSGLAFTLFRLGDLALEEGNYAPASALLQEALAIYRTLNDPYGICGTLMVLGWAAMRTGDYMVAAAHLEECCALAQQAGDRRNTAFALSGLGEIAVRQGRYAQATVLLMESLQLNRAGGYSWSVATVLGSLGWVALAAHDYTRMSAFLGESLALRLEIGDQAGIAWCLEKLAEAALAQGQAALPPARLERYQAAARIFAAAAHLRAPINSVMDAVDQPAYGRSLAALRTGLGEGAFAATWTEGEAMPPAAAVEYALAGLPTAALPEPAPEAAPAGLPHNAAGRQANGLTARAREVVALIAQGKSNREIAAAMTVGVKTVETYITRILNKLGFDSRVQVATWALEQGLAASPSASPSEPRL